VGFVMQPRPVRVGVVGAGSMGENHLRVFQLLKGAELTAVVDTDQERAQECGVRYGCPAFASVEEALNLVDAVTIATPSVSHAEVGTAFLERSIHCLVEKPLAPTEKECNALIEAADASDAKLLVGHIERFNPAVQALFDLVASGCEIHALDARRMSAVGARVTDVDVVTDLMVHDLDIILSLMDAPPSDLFARGLSVGHGSDPDYVSAILAFDGAVASLTASRITENKVRTLQATTSLGFVTLDYSTQELLIFQQGRVAEPGSVPRANYVLDIAMERVFVRNVEPLMVELSHFIDVAAGNAEPLVSGRDALKSLKLVWNIQASVRDGPR